ncbi:6,7-dimethyl-8-ribityllumazine synthase [Ruficoccus amylovorans]|uniref:6,7-dimethyl-8-ribityllumazine synthase n=1 Tax=Ruficoccus amylovorans TaxID=1804625 RepID=A0A842HIW4_9BACT|nr:6,7-dimethyl-8-ribityllumazine synthase [Ruficoccus amylovorans]MBC2596453.1 6,7-dimethyl-8-ribityllumazine synthase [Ruficoccus amylovorans]
MSFHAPEPLKIDGSELYFGIVAARYNGAYVDALIERVSAVLKEAGVPRANVRLERVPGSNEIPYLATMMAATRQYDCIIALGVIIRGGTAHDEVIAHSTASILHRVAMQTECPVINGILTVNNTEQAEERVNGHADRGGEFARAALEMARHKVNYVQLLDEIDAEAAADDINDLFNKN